MRSVFFWNEQETIEGEVSISPDLFGNSDIDFYVTDSSGNIVFNPGRIYNGYNFRYTVPRSGNYYVYFDNEYDILTSKDGYYEIRTFPAPNNVALVGMVIIIVGLVLVAGGVLLNYRQTRSQSYTQAFEPPPPPPPQ